MNSRSMVRNLSGFDTKTSPWTHQMRYVVPVPTGFDVFSNKTGKIYNIKQRSAFHTCVRVRARNPLPPTITSKKYKSQRVIVKTEALLLVTSKKQVRTGSEVARPAEQMYPPTSTTSPLRNDWIIWICSVHLKLFLTESILLIQANNG
jgi:hypothetical protein